MTCPLKGLLVEARHFTRPHPRRYIDTHLHHQITSSSCLVAQKFQCRFRLLRVIRCPLSKVIRMKPQPLRVYLQSQYPLFLLSQTSPCLLQKLPILSLSSLPSSEPVVVTRGRYHAPMSMHIYPKQTMRRSDS